MIGFQIEKNSYVSLARVGVLKTAHGTVKTPFFMPIGTRGSVKALTASDLQRLKSGIILANTYHLYLRPGLSVLKSAGGLHCFMDWPGSILTDSGGYQVFSLGEKLAKPENKKSNFVKISQQGVEFRSVYDGSKHLFTPKKVLEIQNIIGSDIRMVLDVCSPSDCSRQQAEKYLAITLKWAEESRRFKKIVIKKFKKSDFLLFGIVQGALYKDLRLKSAQVLSEMNFDGYAVGGLAVGESPREMYKVLDYTVPSLPAEKPHYLMGVGYPEQIVEAVKRGIDMFDCVIPTREARHGRLYIRNQKQLTSNRKNSNSKFQILKFYEAINIKSAKFTKDNSAINFNSKIPELKNYSKAYLRHLFSVGEPLAIRLATLNNLEFYLNLMTEIRTAIKNNKL